MNTASTGDGFNVEVTHEIHADCRELINRGLTEFNKQHLGEHKWAALDVYVRDPDGQVVGFNAGWGRDEIFLGSLYVLPSMQRLGIGTHVLRSLLARAAHQSKVLTLAVMKLNPAVRLYERLGFRITHQDANFTCGRIRKLGPSPMWSMGNLPEPP